MPDAPLRSAGRVVRRGILTIFTRTPRLRIADRGEASYRKQAGLDEHAVDEGLRPGERQPHYDLIRYTGWENFDQYPEVRDWYRKQAAEQAGDPPALYLAGVALYRFDTPESIRLLEAARQGARLWLAGAATGGNLLRGNTDRQSEIGTKPGGVLCSVPCLHRRHRPLAAGQGRHERRAKKSGGSPAEKAGE